MAYLVWISLLIAFIPQILHARQKGDKYEEQGRAAESRQEYDNAVEWYEKALETEPSDVKYILATRRARSEACIQHVSRGQKLREKGEIDGAVSEFQKAFTADPSSAVAMEELMRATASARSGGVNQGTPLEKSRTENSARVTRMTGPVELRPLLPQIPSLKMNNQPPKIVYETVAKLAGVNVLFDPQYTPQVRNLSVEFSNASIEEALDYIAVLTRTFWKPVSATTVFVTEDNPTKRRDYEDNVARVFYVQNATSMQEFQELATAVRSLTEIRRVFTCNAQHAILVRGTRDQVALAGKLVQDLDKLKAEVIVDVVVLQANSSRTRTLAAHIASSSGGLSIPVSFTPRNPVTTTSSSSSSSSSTTTSAAISMAGLGHISSGDFATTLPGALLNLVMADSRTKVLQSPRVRASDGQKVTLKIGEKVPYATGSYSPCVATTVTSLVSTQFNYADVGVNIDLTPQVHGSKEVTLKVAIEISTVASHVDIGGIDQPVIAQQRSESEIRMREGEVNILSGLNQASDTKSLSGIPGLVSIPMLGRLLGGESADKERSELLIAIVPHIVRTPEYSDDNLREIQTGTDQVVKVSYAPVTASAPLTSIAPVATGTTPVTPAPPAATSGQMPARRLAFTPESASLAPGETVQVALRAVDLQRLTTHLPIRIQFDPHQVRMDDIAPGAAIDSTGFTRDIRNDSGQSSISFAAARRPKGGTYEASVAILRFTALAKGDSVVTIAAGEDSAVFTVTIR